MSQGDTADPIDAQSAVAPPSWSHDQDYCFRTVFFRVEDRIFNVPRYHFERFEPFAGMFSLPPGDDGACEEGKSDSKPIFLQDKKCADFQALLKVLYPLDAEMIMNEPHKWMTTDEWISVLKLSTEWWMVRFRKLAIAKLDQRDISSIQRIMLARQYHVAPWLRQGYLELVQRTETIPDDEAEVLGWKTTCRLVQARERTPSARLGSCQNCGRKYHYRHEPPRDFVDVVESIFAEEFRQAELASAEY